MALTAVGGSNSREFKPHVGCVVVCLENAFFGCFSCLVATFVIEMHCASSTGNSEAGLNTTCK